MGERSVESVIALLANTLGDATAREVVEREVRLAGLGRTVSDEDAVAILTKIEQGGGPSGLGARLAKLRLQRAATGVSSAAVAAVAATGAKTPRIAVSQLVSMFTPALGVEKATETIRTALTALDVRGETITLDDAAVCLERLGRQGGVIATVARFAKARLLLATG